MNENKDAVRLDSIRVSNIRASGRHGVSASERENCLPLEIEVLLHIDLRKASRSDDLDDTVNYSTIHHKVVDIVERSSFKLLERLAMEVLMHLFEDKRIRWASISISKPQRLKGATPTVSISRENDR
ncbi:MAG TPA: dihydroneopterin aldolase [Oculatellaceae cyanobacterium]